MTRPLTLADLGEDLILERIFPLLPAARATVVGPGDDAAVLQLADERVVATTDVMVERLDFRLDWSTAEDIGVKAAAQNLADLAAMGARPRALLVALVAPGSLAITWVEGFARGLAEGCAGTGAGVIGGDLSSGERIIISVTALGDLTGGEPVRRSGAQWGDTVAVAGTLGRSAAGLAVLQRGLELPRLAEFVLAHRRPTPPYAAALAAGSGAIRANAMLDISDGLVRDAERIARASGVTLALDPERIDWHATELRVPGEALGVDPQDWVLSGGEDHGFLATFPAGELPPGFSPLGVVQAAGLEPVVIGSHPPQARGWDHFRQA
ncbi:MAG: thiamine-phosphate kinase [Angustibacter sp.]